MTRKQRKSEGKSAAGPSPAAPPKAPIDWRRHAYYLLAVWLLALAVYSNSFGGKLQVDSGFVVRDDLRIRAASAGNLGAIWSTGYWYNYQDTTLYRPLTTLSFLVNYAVLGNGPRPEGYHWVNFLLHAINASLVYGLGLLIFRKRAQSAALAGLWAVHPVLTESVTNIVGRADMLASIGVLAGLICHAQATAASGRRKWAWTAGIAAASAVAIFSKESGIVLIALMLVYDLATRQGGLRLRVAPYAAAALPVLVFLYQRAQVLAALPIQEHRLIDNPLIGAGFWSGRLTAIHVIGRYLALIVWPRHLSYDYSYNQVPVFQGNFGQWADWATILSLLACLALAAVTAVGYRRSRPVFFFLALFFVALAPVANIALLVGTIMAERFLYLPAVGLVGFLVWAVYAGTGLLKQRWPQLSVQPLWILGLMGLALLVRAHVRNADWDTSTALYASGVEAAPGSYRTHLNQAISLKDLGNLDGAVTESDRCMSILRTLPAGEGGDMVAYANIGAIYRLKGESVAKSAGSDSEPRPWYGKSLQVLLQGDAVDRHNAARLTQINQAAGRPRMIFGTVGLYQELGLTYLRLGDSRKAIEAIEYGTGIRPDSDLFPILSSSYAAMGDRDGAAVALMEGLMIQPGQRQLSSFLIDLYRGAPSSCALEQKGGAVSVNFSCAEVHTQVCAGAGRARELFERRGQYGEAARVAQMAATSFGCAAQ